MKIEKYTCDRCGMEMNQLGVVNCSIKIIKGIEELVAKVGQEKLEVPVEGDLNEVVSLIEKSYKEDVQALLDARVARDSGNEDVNALIEKINEEIHMKDAESTIDKKVIAAGVEKVMYKIYRDWETDRKSVV